MGALQAAEQTGSDFSLVCFSRFFHLRISSHSDPLLIAILSHSDRSLLNSPAHVLPILSLALKSPSWSMHFQSEVCF